MLPDSFDLLMDPGYEIYKSLGLRWDASHETAYPSTFLIDGMVSSSLARLSRSTVAAPPRQKF